MCKEIHAKKVEEGNIRFNNIYCSISCQWKIERIIRGDKCLLYNEKLAGSVFTGYAGAYFRCQKCIKEHKV